jgi:hypothetical protein
MAEELKSPTFEEVVAQKEALEVSEDGQPKPDMPVTIAAPAYGDPGHVNPALNPAPLWEAPPERKIVPVQNDPGVLGAAPALADLNRAYRADDMERGGSRARVAIAEPQKGKREEIDDTMGVTEENNQEDVRKAAEARMERLLEKQEKAKGKVARKNDDKPAPHAPAHSKKG